MSRDDEIDKMREQSLLTRIARRHRNQVTTAKFMLSEVTRLMGQVEIWHKRIDNLNQRQLVGLLHVSTKMRADVQALREMAKDVDQEQWDTLQLQAQILQEVIKDVAVKLKAIGGDIDIVMTELKPVEMADIMLSQSLNDLAIVSDEEVRGYQMSADFAGLVEYLNNNTAFDIVAALLQLPNDKSVEILRLINETQS